MRVAPVQETNTSNSYEIAYEPSLVPPLSLMATEGITVLEDWFRWGEEWSMILRMYGAMNINSSVLEIGCGLGRIAFPLRYLLLKGSYEGFDVVQEKIDFLARHFQPAHPNFRFTWANVRNAEYNPTGATMAADFRFPYPRSSFDLIFAASLFTHLLPDAIANYFQQAARVLKPGGRCVFSFFLLDYYRPGQPRPSVFGKLHFNFSHPYIGYDNTFASASADMPEQMTACRLSLIEQLAADAGLVLAQPPVPGLWSGSFDHWVCAQDLVVLQKPTLLPNS